MAELLQQPSISPEQEIRELERKLEEKKQALAETQKEVPQEKEVFREVLREHIEDVRPSHTQQATDTDTTSQIPAALSDNSKKKSDDTAQTQAREEKLRALIELALSRTIEDAVRAAEKSTPYLLDELHDHLVDDYYDKLVALRKLKQL